MRGASIRHRTCKLGLYSEKNIVRAINTDERFRDLIKDCLSVLGFKLQGKIKACVDGTKTDIFIKNALKVGVSIKTSTKTSFHHLDRRWLEDWKEFLNMPDEIFKILKQSILRIARDPRNCFILPKDKQKVQKFFATHLKDVIHEIFTKGEDCLKILLINNK